MIIDLSTSRFIGKSAMRECYLHPQDDKKCIRVFIDPETPPDLLLQEIAAFQAVKTHLSAFVPVYEDRLVETTKGPGMVSALVSDDDGNISANIRDYIVKGGDRAEMLSQLDIFYALLQYHDLFFYDFNYKNFVVQLSDGKPKLKYIDLKSYRRHNAFIKLDRLSPWFARRMMDRRMQRFIERVKNF